MNSVELFNFSEQLRPHGEDSISYEYQSSNLCVTVFFNDSKSKISLLFTNCSYQYFAPVPGFYPDPFKSVMSLHSGCIYEIFGSVLLEKSEKVAEQAGYKPNWRHFFLYLEWANISLHVLANNFEYKKVL